MKFTESLGQAGTCALLCLASAVPLAGQEAQAEDGPSDERLRAVWAELSADQRREVSAWYQAEIQVARTYQGQLVSYIFAQVEHDPRAWPRATPDPPTYQASVHAPAQVIKRRFVERPNSRQKAWIDKVFRSRAKDLPSILWTYDYGRGTVVSHAQGRSSRPTPTHIFELALAGRVPDSDLAQAIVAGQLDQGQQRAAHLAFSHAYSDREGRALREVNLYDVWGSGLEMEMPDVECLGIVHDVLGDWETWVAPVPPTQHDELYETIGGIFMDLRAEREMGQALAATLLQADPPLAATYRAHRDRMHALWAEIGCNPRELVKDLPTTHQDLEEFWQKRGKDLDSNLALWEAGGVRRAALAADSATVRRTLIWVMEQLELLSGD